MPINLRDVLQATANQLKQAGIESARLDARVLVSHVLGLEPSSLITRDSKEVADAELESLKVIVARRLNHEPVSRIVGEREFWSLSFQINSATLDPRPDTETVVDVALGRVAERGPAPQLVLDAGVGSGCILLSLLSEWEGAVGIGVDLSPAALSVSRQNAQRLGYSERALFVASDWLSTVDGPFDVIVANPPYIAEKEAEGLSKDVVDFDPDLALFGGPDGLDAFRRLIPESRAKIAKGGLFVTEFGIGQSEAVTQMLAHSGYRDLEVHKDLAGTDRCVSALA